MNRTYIACSALAIVALVPGCREFVDYNSGNIDFEPDRPEINDAEEVEPYDGDNELVIEAQERFPTGLELHNKVIWRTCTPNGGVCHNAAEYPDLRTPATFVEAFSAPCNIQAGEYQSVYDGCEQPGDRLVLNGGPYNDNPNEVGYLQYIPGELGDDETPTEESPGLHIVLAEPIGYGNDSGQGYATAEFIRTFEADGELYESEYASFQTNWSVLGDGTHLYGQIRQYQVNGVNELLTVGLVEGDGNRNGTFGAKEEHGSVHLLEPGSPETSYLIARVRGEMYDEQIPGSRMPLANAPLTIPEMLSLFCMVEAFPEGGDLDDFSGPIDYNGCSYADDPESLNLLGSGVTWESRIKIVFQANCGGCHSGTQPAAGLDMLSDDVYESLLQESSQLPDMKLIEPGDPMASYLFLKLIDDDQIEGNPMPFNPLTGEGSLTQAEISDIETWILNGAIEDE